MALCDNRSERDFRVLSGVSTIERQAGELISTKGSFTEDASVLVSDEMSLKDVKDEKE